MNNILILMAGEGTRMTHTNIPKPFIEFNHVPLFHYCSESFNRKDKNNHLISNCEDLKKQQKFTIKMHDGEVVANFNEVSKNNNLVSKKVDNQPNFFDLIEK